MKKVLLISVFFALVALLGTAFVQHISEPAPAIVVTETSPPPEFKLRLSTRLVAPPSVDTVAATPIDRFLANDRLIKSLAFLLGAAFLGLLFGALLRRRTVRTDALLQSELQQAKSHLSETTTSLQELRAELKAERALAAADPEESRSESYQSRQQYERELARADVLARQVSILEQRLSDKNDVGQGVDLYDYVGVLSRRYVAFTLTAGVIFAASLAVMILWPPTYRSTATVLIEEQNIPTDIVRSVVTSPAVQRIQAISQSIMTHANLLRIAKKFDLYADAIAEGKTEAALAGMRKRIKIETVDVNVVDPGSGRPGRVVIAFTVSYTHRVPEITQLVAQEVASLFLEQNDSSRASMAKETLQFLSAEADMLSEQIASMESDLAAFKEQNQTSLPELKNLNLRLMDQVERQLTSVENQIRSLQERKYSLEGQLAQVNPYSPMVATSGESLKNPVMELRSLRAEYISLTARFSDRHPDVNRLRRQIENLEQQVGSVDVSSEVARELERQRGALLVAENRYGENHPEVVQLHREIAALESVPGDSTTKTAGRMTATDAEPDNPSYIALRTRLKGVNSELSGLRALRTELDTRLLEYGQRFARAPRIEQDYLTLSREYESAIERYTKIREDQIDARVALDEDQSPENFSLIDPAQIPEKAISPNRSLIGMLGFLLALVGGLVVAIIIDARDPGPRQAGTQYARAERTIAELRQKIGAFNEAADELSS